MTEEEMVGWHHQVNEHEFEQTLGDSEEQGLFSWFFNTVYEEDMSSCNTLLEVDVL